MCRIRYTQYTKQGILCMLRTGIIVEPTLMREWHTMVGNIGDYGMSTTMRAHTHTHTALTISEWTQLRLDRHVRGAQTYINECRLLLDMREMYWSSAVHDVSAA